MIGYARWLQFEAECPVRSCVGRVMHVTWSHLAPGSKMKLVESTYILLWVRKWRPFAELQPEVKHDCLDTDGLASNQNENPAISGEGKERVTPSKQQLQGSRRQSALPKGAAPGISRKGKMQLKGQLLEGRSLRPAPDR